MIFAYCYRCYRSVVCLSVTFVHCAQTAEDIDSISFPYSHIGQSFPLQNLLQVTYPAVDLNVRDIRWQIAAEWSERAQHLQWRAYTGNHHCSFEWYHRRSPIRPPLPEMGPYGVPPGATSRHVQPPGEYDRRTMSPLLVCGYM